MRDAKVFARLLRLERALVEGVKVDDKGAVARQARPPWRGTAPGSRRG